METSTPLPQCVHLPSQQPPSPCDLQLQAPTPLHPHLPTFLWPHALMDDPLVLWPLSYLTSSPPRLFSSTQLGHPLPIAHSRPRPTSDSWFQAARTWTLWPSLQLWLSFSHCTSAPDISNPVTPYFSSTAPSYSLVSFPLNYPTSFPAFVFCIAFTTV